MTLAEEIVLLTLDEASGTTRGRQGAAASLALAGAVMMDLSLHGRIDTDRDTLLLPSGAPTGEAVLDDALRALSLDPPRDSRAALLLLARDDEARRAMVLDGLVARGMVRRDRGNILRLFSTRYPANDAGVAVAEVRTRLRALAMGDDIPEPRDALLLSLARATGLLPLIFSADELAMHQERLALLARLEALGRSLGETIAGLHATRLRAAGS